MKPASILPSLCVAVLLTQAAIPSMAADLIVEENGVLPNYASIQDAVTAATPGDRIIVKNKAGGDRYFENVVIDKPLTFLANVEGGTFDVGGSWSVNPNATNFSQSSRSIRIVGMNNSVGGVFAAGNNVTGTTILVDVHGSVLNGISLSSTGYAARISGNHVSSITAREAHIIGNQVRNSITILDGSATSELGDTSYVVGNRLAVIIDGSPSSSNPAFGGIVWSNSAQYAHITNNHVYSSMTSPMLVVSNLKSGTGRNLIANNSFRTSLSLEFSELASLDIPVGARLLVSSNALQGGFSNSSFAGIFLAGNVELCEIAHNVFGNISTNSSDITSGATGAVKHDNLRFDSLVINTLTGICGSPCIDAGYPTVEHTDHDGTRNDVGVAGGSFNPSNFWPLQTGSARVFLVKAPRVVTQGTTIQVEASAVDR